MSKFSFSPNQKNKEIAKRLAKLFQKFEENLEVYKELDVNMRYLPWFKAKDGKYINLEKVTEITFENNNDGNITASCYFVNRSRCVLDNKASKDLFLMLQNSVMFNDTKSLIMLPLIVRGFYYAYQISELYTELQKHNGISPGSIIDPEISFPYPLELISEVIEDISDYEDEDEDEDEDEYEDEDEDEDEYQDITIGMKNSRGN